MVTKTGWRIEVSAMMLPLRLGSVVGVLMRFGILLYDAFVRALTSAPNQAIATGFHLEVTPRVMKPQLGAHRF
jgi:hypothetical protein